MEVKDDYWVSTFRYATPSTQYMYLNLLEKVLSSDFNTDCYYPLDGQGRGHWVGAHEA